MRAPIRREFEALSVGTPRLKAGGTKCVNVPSIPELRGKCPLFESQKALKKGGPEAEKGPPHLKKELWGITPGAKSQGDNLKNLKRKVS